MSADKLIMHVQLVEDSNGNVKIVSSNAGKEFAAEEISAQVLRKLVDDASKFLNDKVTSSCKPCTAAQFFCVGQQLCSFSFGQ